MVVKAKPTISIQPPFNYGKIDYAPNVFQLYSYHRLFKLNDFSGLINITAKSKSSQENYNQNWSILIPEVRLITTASKKDQIVFSNIRFKINEDTLTDYKDKVIPILSATSFPMQVADEIGFFRQKLDTIEQFEPKNYSAPPYFEHTYIIYVNNLSVRSIKIPTTKSFKVTVNDYDSQNSEDFQVQFHKISRLSLFVDLPWYLSLEKINHRYRDFPAVGIGVEYLFYLYCLWKVLLDI